MGQNSSKLRGSTSDFVSRHGSPASASMSSPQFSVTHWIHEENTHKSAPGPLPEVRSSDFAAMMGGEDTMRPARRGRMSPTGRHSSASSFPARQARAARHGTALSSSRNANPACAPSLSPGSTAAGRPPPAPPVTARSTAGARRGAGARRRPSVRSGAGSGRRGGAPAVLPFGPSPLAYIDPDSPRTRVGPRHRSSRQSSASGRSRTARRTPERRPEVNSRQHLYPAGSSAPLGPVR